MIKINPSILSKTVKAITPKTEKVEEAQIRGTIVFRNNEQFVQLDGAPDSALTPISDVAEGASDAGFVDGDRVLVLLKNHQAIVTKNLTVGLQAQAAKEAGSFVTTITDEGITAQRIIANDTFTNTLRANHIKADDIIAGMATIDTLGANYAHITNGVIDNAKIGVADVNGLNANYAHITQGVIDNAKIGHADVNGLNANYAHITQGVIDNAKIGYADVNNLNTHYAEIDMANVNNAWIDHGAMKKAEVFDENVFDLSGDHATIKRIDASKINVANLRADNLVVRRINGQPVVGGYTLIDSNSPGYSSKNPKALGWYEFVNAQWVLSTDTTVDMTKAYYQEGNEVSLYDQQYIDDMENDLQQQIDGAVETFTGSVVPTLTNYPYTDWYDTSVTPTHDERAKHVGDIYYVVNSSLDEGGYCYRFTYDNTTTSYDWVLIKDSDVTKALSDISELQTFESETTSWIDETDEGLETIRTNHTALAGVVDKTVKESVQLWFTKANTTAPDKPNSKTYPNGVTSTSTAGNDWRKVVPAYNASYPNYYYCWQYKFVDGTFDWSAVVRDIAMGETQGTSRDAKNTADAALPASTFTSFESTTFKDVKDNVNEHSVTFTNMTSRLGMNSDGTGANTDVVAKESALETTVDGISTRVGKTETKLIGMYATSSTAEGTAAKVATITPALPSGATWELGTGTIIAVKFTNANTAANPTLNVNSKGAKAIKTYANGNLTEAEYKWKAGSTFTFAYNGTNWLMQDSSASVRMNSAETGITQNAEQIALRAKSSDVYTKGQVYTKTEADSAITQKANEISLSVAQTEISKIEVGGRNLLKNSNDGSKYSWSQNNGAHSKTVDESGATFTITELPVSGSWGVFMVSDASLRTNILAKETYTLSFDIKTSVAISDLTFGFNIREGNSANPYLNDHTVTVSTTANTWVHIVNTTTAKDTLPSNSNSNLYITAPKLKNQLCSFSIKNVKVEKGNKATDWTPAPEDLEDYADGAVATAKAEIKVTTDSISTEVKKKTDKSTIISTIRQSAETVKIKASQVEIDGTATFNAIKSNADAAYDSKGSASAVQTNLDNLEIGGKNILRGTNNITIANGFYPKGEWYKSGTGTVTTSVAISDSPLPAFTTAVQLTTTAANTEVGIAQGGVPFHTGEITHSVWVKGTAGDTIRLQPIWAGGTNVPESGSKSFTIADGNWHKYTFTKSVAYNHPIGSSGSTTSNTYANAGYVYFKSATVGHSCLVIGDMLEYGNKATDWTLAPEDVQAEIDGIQIGGRNKAALSYIWNRTGSTYTTNGITFTNLGGGRFSAVGTATNAGDIWWCNASGTSTQLGTGGTYTYTIYLESGTMPANIGLQAAEANSGGTWQRNNRSSGGATTYTFSTLAGNHPYHLGFWAVAANTAINITFRLKFEEGNKATDWTPAPEDVEADINDLSSRATAYRGILASRTDGALVVDSTGFTLAIGATISVYFRSSNNYAGKLTLNVNDTGAKDVWVGDLVTSDTNRLFWHWGSTITFTYDGTQWRVSESPGTYYGTSCSTAEATAAKATTIPSGVIFKGCVLEVPMTNANTSTSPSLSINNTAGSTSNLTGEIRYGTGSTIPTKANGFSWLAGMSVIFKYDGKYWRTGNQTIIDGSHILTGTINADRIGANSITADKISIGAIEEYENILLDSDAPTLTKVKASYNRYFSDGGNNKIVCSNFTLTDAPEQGLKYGRRFTYDGSVATNNYVRSYAFYDNGTNNSIPLVPNQTYTATWWARCTSGSGRTQFYYSKGDGATGAVSGTIYTLSRYWKKYTHSFTFGSALNTNYNRIWFRALFPKSTAGTVEICGCKLTVGADTESYITRINSDGIRIHPSSTENNSVVINSTGMEVFKGGTEPTNSVAFYGDSARVGKTSAGHVVTASNGIELWGDPKYSNDHTFIYSSGISIGVNSDSGDIGLGPSGNIHGYYNELSENVTEKGITIEADTASSYDGPTSTQAYIGIWANGSEKSAGVTVDVDDNENFDRYEVGTTIVRLIGDKVSIRCNSLEVDGNNTPISFVTDDGTTIDGATMTDALVADESNNLILGRGWWAKNTSGYNTYIEGYETNLWGRNKIATNRAITQGSDKKLKKDIKNLEDVKDFVMDLKPVEFKYEFASDKDKHLGFIAQDVERSMDTYGLSSDKYGLITEITGTDNIQYKGLNYTEFIPMCIKMIQEQQQEIDALKEALNEVLGN